MENVDSNLVSLPNLFVLPADCLPLEKLPWPMLSPFNRLRTHHSGQTSKENINRWRFALGVYWAVYAMKFKRCPTLHSALLDTLRNYRIVVARFLNRFLKTDIFL